MTASLSKIPRDKDFETKKILKKIVITRAALAELKWVSDALPNKSILISTLSLQEAKDSSAIENIITTNDELFRSDSITQQFTSLAAKEVYNYAEALREWYISMKKTWILRNKDILNIQAKIEQNRAWFRTLPGTSLKNDQTGEIIYVPPQHPEEISLLMDDLVTFINTPHPLGLDPLVCVAIIHHQFESIHPFYDGNGRTGRILNILYLVKEWLLHTPILYLSRYINKNKADYYRLLQSVRTDNTWEEWILFLLEGIEVTAIETIELIGKIRELMLSQKNIIRTKLPKIYSQDLLNNIFKHPYTKIDFMVKDIWKGRITATKYLDQLCSIWILEKIRLWKENFYIHTALFKLLQDI